MRRDLTPCPRATRRSGSGSYVRRRVCGSVRGRRVAEFEAAVAAERRGRGF